MRQKKSNLIYYIIAAVVLGVVGLVLFTEIPMNVEHIEEIIN